MLKRFKIASFALSVAFGMMMASNPYPSNAEQQCDVQSITERTKAIAQLSAFQDGLNFLVISQSIAIIEIETGAPVWPIHVEESSFFGPLVGLRKSTDKTETYLKNLDKEIRRLATFDEFSERYEDIDRANKKLVDAGYKVLTFLTEDSPDEAQGVLTSVTLPGLEGVRGHIYTTVSELERAVTLDGLRCR